MKIEKLEMPEDTFRYLHDDDEVGSDALGNAIRSFARHAEKLENTVRTKLVGMRSKF